jgi:large subunit ribosomal protein L30
MGDVTITQVRSATGSSTKHRGTLRALGLGRIGKSRTHADSPSLQGMLLHVNHLVQIERAGGAEETEDVG